MLALATAQPKLPLHILTGFLGSGKTTLLNRILTWPEFTHSAVIINEYGRIGVDHWLVQQRVEAMRLLPGGCLCCSQRSDLVAALEMLFHQRRKGEVPLFERVLIETTGLADPGPILRTLLIDEFVSAHYQIENIITTIDAVHGLEQLGAHDESVKQAALADELVLTKTDLADNLQTLQARLKLLNPRARCWTKARLHPQALLGSGQYDPCHAKWLPTDRLQAAEYAIAAHRHDAFIRHFFLRWRNPLPWVVLERWLQQLTRLRGKDLLRVKGLVYTVETPLPVVLQGVQHLFQPPVTLPAWPDGQACTQLVFITRNIEQATVEKHLQAVLACNTPQDASHAALLLL